MKKSFLIIVLSLFVGVTLYSQDSLSVLQAINPVIVRIAYINRAEIVVSVPQVQVIEKELLELEEDYKAEFEKMAKEYESKVKSYLERNKQMSEPIRLARQTEITELEARMSMYKKRYQEELAKLNNELIHALTYFAVKTPATPASAVPINPSRLSTKPLTIPTIAQTTIMPITIPSIIKLHINTPCFSIL